MGAFGDALHNFFHPEGLTPENQQRLNDAIKNQDDANAELNKAGKEFLSELTGVDLSGISDSIDSVQQLLDDLTDPPIDPEDFKTNVIRADLALAELENFRTKKLIEFYKSAVTSIKEETATLFDGSTRTEFANAMKSGDIATIANKFIETVKNVLQIALDVKQLIDYADERMKALSKEVLTQSKPELKKTGPHRSRKSVKS